jgi:hypothetical protein
LENRGKNEGEGREKERDEEVRPEEDEREWAPTSAYIKHVSNIDFLNINKYKYIQLSYAFDKNKLSVTEHT